MTAATTTQSSVVADAIAQHQHRQGPLLPILHDVQHALGHIPGSAVAEIAQALNLSRAEVHGVVTFYHTFTSEQQGKHIVEVCRAESCQSMGGQVIEDAFKQKLGLDWGETSADKQVTLEPVYCLGNCACSPSVRIGKQIYGRVSLEQVDQLVESVKGGK